MDRKLKEVWKKLEWKGSPWDLRRRLIKLINRASFSAREIRALRRLYKNELKKGEPKFPENAKDKYDRPRIFRKRFKDDTCSEAVAQKEYENSNFIWDNVTYHFPGKSVYAIEQCYTVEVNSRADEATKLKYNPHKALKNSSK